MNKLKRIEENVPQFEVSEATKLLEKRRVLYEVQEAYDQQIKEYNHNMEKFRRQEEKIKENDYKVQENFIKYCKFLTENKNKRDRAQRHLEEEQQVKNQKLKEIADEQKNLDLLEQHKKLFETKIQSLAKYEEYLQRVVMNNQEQYSDIGDLLQRFQILQDSNTRLKEEEQTLENRQEELNHQINKFVKEKNDKIMLLNNQIAGLQKDLDTLELNYANTKDKINDEEQNTANKMQMLAKMMLSIDNIYDITQNSNIKIRIDKKSTDDLGFSKIKYGKENNQEQSKDRKVNEYDVEGYLEKLNVIQASGEAYKKIIDMYNKEKRKNA